MRVMSWKPVYTAFSNACRKRRLLPDAAGATASEYQAPAFSGRARTASSQNFVTATPVALSVPVEYCESCRCNSAIGFGNRSAAVHLQTPSLALLVAHRPQYARNFVHRLEASARILPQTPQHDAL